MEQQPDWWKTTFDGKYLDTYLERFPPEQTSKETEFVIRVADLKPEDRILDLACGYGRHSIELARRGFSIVGLDYSEALLNKAQTDAREAGVSINFIRGDMRNLPLKESKFDVVLSMFTSFGYFSDEENQQTLNQIGKVLKPRGRLILNVVVLDIRNLEVMLTREKAEKQEGTNTYRSSKTLQVGNFEIKETSYFDLDTQVWYAHREWLKDSERKEYDFWIKFYSMDQLGEMLSRSGLQIKNYWADFDGNPYNAHFPPAFPGPIILAEK